MGVALLLLAAGPLQAQSITRGVLEGSVRDSAGAPFPDARVRVTDAGTGVTWWLVTSKDGRFQLPLLPPGAYDVFAEALGYQPVRVEAVPVRPGGTRRLSLTLRPARLPVNEVEVRPYTGPGRGSRAGASQWYTPFELFALPERARGLSELGRLSTIANTGLDSEGLPGRLSGFALDGLPYSPARHSDLSGGPLDAAALPMSAFAAAELYTSPLDVEWSEHAGAILSGYTRRGTARPQVLAYGDWTGGIVTSSDDFSGRDLGTHSFRGGALASGPIIRDTAHYVIGFEAQRLQTPVPRPWAIDSLDAALTAAAGSLGVPLAPYTQPLLAGTDLGSAFGRFDWQITPNHAVSVRGNLAALEAGGGGRINSPGLGPDRIASLEAELTGLDLALGATLVSRLGRVFSEELRVGLERSDREYKAAAPIGTRILDGGLGFGMDPAVPGEFKRFALRGSYTAHIALGRHQLKAGIGGLVTSLEQRYAFGSGGEFRFAGPGELAALRGTFEQAAGAPPFARFRNWQLSLYLQDNWAAAPGLDLLLGLRYERETLDREEVSLEGRWLQLTGLANNGFDDGLDKLSPRFGFLWDVGQRGTWRVRGTAGVYHGLVTPGLFGELATQDGGVEARLGVGALGSWPDAPDLGAAPLAGPRLTLFGPDFGPPRTARASLGISHLLRDGTGVHLSGAYRYTDFLPRRKDLNLAQAPAARDQYGRPIWGTLVQEGSLLAVEPGSNRRFPDFDLVSALDADGVSKFWDVTFAVERHLNEQVQLLAAYTYSWTEDDWPGAWGGGPDLQLTPFPGGLDGADWADGRSDLDVPHRAVIGAQVEFPTALAGGRLAALYRFASGRPFTPGFRAGVDANGDGSGRNDPAFVDADLPGMDALLQKWDCLVDQVGKFAERNSCRGPDLHRLDARFALGLYEVQGRPIELVIDGLNLLDSDTGVRDAALLLVDRAGSLLTAPDGTVTVPLIANPNFGEPLVRRSTGRVFRFGLRIGL